MNCVLANENVSAFDQLFLPSFQPKFAAIKNELLATVFDSTVQQYSHFYALLAWNALFGGQSDIAGKPCRFHLRDLESALSGTAFASIAATLFAEIRHFVLSSKRVSLTRPAEFLRTIHQTLRTGLKDLIADLGVTAFGVGTWHVVKKCVASYVASWACIIDSLGEAALSIVRAIYLLICGHRSMRERVHASVIELAAALSLGTTAGLQVLLPRSLTILAGGPWLNAIVPGTMYAYLVDWLEFIDVAGAIHERSHAIVIGEAQRALSAAEKSAKLANLEIMEIQSFYQSLGVNY